LEQFQESAFYQDDEEDDENQEIKEKKINIGYHKWEF